MLGYQTFFRQLSLEIFCQFVVCLHHISIGFCRCEVLTLIKSHCFFFFPSMDWALGSLCHSQTQGHLYFLLCCNFLEFYSVVFHIQVCYLLELIFCEGQKVGIQIGYFACACPVLAPFVGKTVSSELLLLHDDGSGLSERLSNQSIEVMSGFCFFV